MGKVFIAEKERHSTPIISNNFAGWKYMLLVSFQLNQSFSHAQIIWLRISTAVTNWWILKLNLVSSYTISIIAIVRHCSISGLYFPSSLLLKCSSLLQITVANLFEKTGNMFKHENERWMLVWVYFISFLMKISYPSGRVAVICVKWKPGKHSFYTIAYSDEPDAKMIANFTPLGEGCCNHSDKIIRYGIFCV